MEFTDICKKPYEAGQHAFESGMSIYANPFRNVEGHASEYVTWIEGYTAAREADTKKKDNSQ